MNLTFEFIIKKSKGLILFSMRSKWERHYKKRIRSCNEVSITKKKNQVRSLLPIPNGVQSKLKWSSDFTIQNRNGARSSI